MRERYTKSKLTNENEGQQTNGARDDAVMIMSCVEGEIDYRTQHSRNPTVRLFCSYTHHQVVFTLHRPTLFQQFTSLPFLH
jgi:hypothetical protein